MPRDLSTMLSIVIAGMTFLLVVLWPARIGPRHVHGPPDVQLADAGRLEAPGADGRDAATRPVTTRSTGTAAASTAPVMWHRPRFSDLQDERDRMVRQTISNPSDMRQAVQEPCVLEAMRNVPRHLFVEPDQLGRAYADYPLPIGYGQTISQPYIVALMTEALRLRPGDKVLEIGTGSGYQAAVLSELTPNVYTMEIIEPLEKRASQRLAKLGYKTIRCKQGDGYFGWPEAAPFEGVIVTCAAGHVPPPLFRQLAPGGRMVIPLGEPGMYQQLKVVTKDPRTLQPRYQTICGVGFVPMTGRIQQQ